MGRCTLHPSLCWHASPPTAASVLAIPQQLAQRDRRRHMHIERAEQPALWDLDAVVHLGQGQGSPLGVRGGVQEQPALWDLDAVLHLEFR